MQMTQQPSVSAVPLAELTDEYHRRGLDRLSDVDLVHRVGQIVARPRRDPPDSFVLHAPLELAARAALLAHVRPDRRELARLHILAVAAQYEAFGPEIEHRDDVDVDPDGAPSAVVLAEAISDGDLEGTDAAARAVATESTPQGLATAFGDFLAPLTAAAAHGPIFLHQLLRGDRRGGITIDLLRPLARDLARNPAWRIGWTDDWVARHDTDVDTLTAAIADTPRIGLSGPAFIHPLMQNVDAPGHAEAHLGDVVGHYHPDAARAVLRCAAQSMLQDSPEHAPYGWTHCLTIPQAVLSLAPFSADPDRILAIAATQVMAFRAGEGEHDLDPGASVESTDHDITELCTVAATSHDAHVVKYVLACFDAAAADPDATGLYLAAARHLLDVWVDRGGDPNDPLAA